MAGRMGGEKVTTLNLEVVQADAERDLAARQGRGARPQGRPRAHPRRREGRSLTMATHRRPRPPPARKAGTVELDDAMFGVEPNVAGHAPGRHRPARRPPGRHASRTKTRAEVRGGGAKPWSRRAPAGPARAPSARRTGRAVAWPSAPSPAATRQRTPKKMIRLALRSALSDRAADGKVVVVDRLGPRRAEHQGRRRRPRGPRRSRAGCSSSSAATTRPCGRASATSPTSTSCDVGELNAYDVLVSRLGRLHPGHAARRPSRSPAAADADARRRTS